jgi:hypothetical protein
VTAIISPQSIFHLMTESLGSARVSLRSKSLTGLFQPPSIILIWSGFSGLFLFRLSQPLYFFVVGGEGEGKEDKEKWIFFFLEQFLESHICSSHYKFPEGRYRVDLNY